jgi:hypothetical protein
MNLEMRLSTRQAKELRHSAESLDVTEAEVIRRSLSLFMYVQDNINGNKLAIVDKNCESIETLIVL